MGEVASGGHALAACLMDTQIPTVVSLKWYWHKINWEMQSSFNKETDSNLDNIRLYKGWKKENKKMHFFKEIAVFNFTSHFI